MSAACDWSHHPPPRPAPTGSLPELNSTTIRGVSLGGNALSGTIPRSYQSAPLLTFLDLSSNRLSGPLAAAGQARAWGALMPGLRCVPAHAAQLPSAYSLHQSKRTPTHPPPPHGQVS